MNPIDGNILEDHELENDERDPQNMPSWNSNSDEQGMTKPHIGKRVCKAHTMWNDFVRK
jgi:hypothetical protein